MEKLSHDWCPLCYFFFNPPRWFNFPLVAPFRGEESISSYLSEILSEWRLPTIVWSMELPE